MNIDRIQVTIQELIDGYEEKGPDGIEGVVAYGGRLDVRPAYQREYIYPDKDRDEVIRSVKKKFPINVMYWAKTADGRYELMDGQQRTISICRYAAVKDEADRQSYEQCFSVDNLYSICRKIRNSASGIMCWIFTSVTAHLLRCWTGSRSST